MPSPNNNISPVIVAAFAASRSRSAAPARAPCILTVDDNRAQLALISSMIDKWGYSPLEAGSGAEAIRLLKQRAKYIDVVLLDRNMPGLSGMELLRQMQTDADLMGIPVIMLTGSSDNAHIQEEINAGVFYHLTKPADPSLLSSVIVAALRECKQKRLLIEEINRHGGALKNMSQCRLSVRTLREAEDAACLIALCLPEPVKAITGFLELMINAVEHGNLGITYQEKTQLLSENRWHEEIERRLTLPQYAERQVDIAYQRKADCWVVQITDEGDGFDWRKHWHIDPAHATCSHGRGIPRARLLAFDNILYNEKGNQVTIVVKPSSKPALKWGQV